jgi:hypothetical protein
VHIARDHGARPGAADGSRDVQTALAASLHAAGYLADPDDLAAVADEAGELIDIAGAFDVGDVIERRIDVVRVRSSTSSP